MYLGDGNGGWRNLLHSVAWTSSLPEEANLLEDSNLVRFMDVDADGRSDLVHVSSYMDAAGWPTCFWAAWPRRC